MPPDAPLDIRDIKPLQHVPLGLPPWVVALIVVAALLLVAGVALWWRWRGRRGAANASAPAEPPDVVTLRELALLAALDCGSAAGRRLYYFRLSELLRWYVEARFGMNATDLTTEEIRARLRGEASLDGEVALELVAILVAADAVKFARQDAAAADCERSLQAAKLFVEKTRQRAEAPAAAQGGG
jgi:hypothetical protein